ncbi:Inositol-1-monophosphatase SuhB [Corynebacterium ciconiae DSM 44920]|uniref:inositol monophosphatase family protein n=1 Tax=Corynebacterium ciconiae TaxID=227319 RepID=UPI000381D045|nr:inositol monophosphatase family protein [Corynebacterium ciconiae]WKD61367.1 Inositol-1-monophosphatase SuhB [Corynebacterium ciconiae DSM 44920]
MTGTQHTPGPDLVSELRRTAITVAEEAREVILRTRAELGGDLRAVTRTKSSAVDPVTVVDEASEEFITTRLEQLRPGDGLIGEEGAHKRSATGVVWIVDPIDGTVNFLYNLPQYAVSIAAAIDGAVVAGAVLNVATGALASAGVGQGAHMRDHASSPNLRPLHCGDAEHLATALVATGFSYAAQRRAEQAELLCTLLPQVRDIRRMGSAALDLVAVADGTVDAYYERGLNAWDFAAGMLIAREAGARVQCPPLSTSSGDNALVLAAQPGIATQLAGVIEGSGSGL